jgi:repressor LexA
MRTMTDRQRELLEIIERSVEDHGYPPSIREMADAMGIRSTNGVNDHLKALEKKGLIARQGASKSRALTVTRPRAESRPKGRRAGSAEGGIPILGRVAAGQPLLAEENLEGHLELPREDGLFALRVKGDSMLEAGIHDGDLVLVRPQSTARPGQIVVALIDGEATVKTFRPGPGRVVLEPANPAHRPIVLEASQGRETWLAGVVTGVFRVVK